MVGLTPFVVVFCLGVCFQMGALACVLRICVRNISYKNKIKKATQQLTGKQGIKNKILDAEQQIKPT